jgi:hypothetical protein
MRNAKNAKIRIAISHSKGFFAFFAMRIFALRRFALAFLSQCEKCFRVSHFGNTDKNTNKNTLGTTPSFEQKPTENFAPDILALKILNVTLLSESTKSIDSTKFTENWLNEDILI